MRKATLILAGVLAVVALAVPAYAGFRVLSDTFHPERGTGVAVLMITPQMYAEVGYRDMDRSQNFTAGDLRIYTRYFRPEPGAAIGGTVLIQRPGR